MNQKTHAELAARVESLLATIPRDALELFKQQYANEISREYTVMMLCYPRLAEGYSEHTLRQMALLFVWGNHNGGDGWRRPPSRPRNHGPLTRRSGIRPHLEPA